MPARALMMDCVLTGLGPGVVFGRAEVRVVVATSARRVGVKCMFGRVSGFGTSWETIMCASQA